MNTPQNAAGTLLSPPSCSEYFVTVTLRIPHRLLGRLTKKAIASKDVELVAADWDKVREVWKSPNTEAHASATKEPIA